jgi:hypothetical protein
VFLRVLVGGAASLVVFALFALVVWSSLPPQQAITARPSSNLARSLNENEQRIPIGGDSWTVTTATSARRALVVQVQAMRLEDALDIAKQIVDPVLAKGYEEILIYVRPPGGFSDGPMRRVQWTPGGGYVEAVFAPIVR